MSTNSPNKERPLKELSPLSVLYHPHFEPDLGTLRRALLVNDAVRSIIPTSANFKPSVALFKHIKSLPDTFIPTPPEEDDVDISADYGILQMLEKAFAQLSKDESVASLKGRFSRSERTWDETLAIGGATYLSAAKLTRAVYMALQRNGLIFATQDDGNFLVDERAANLVVSYLAQRMSNRLAVRTMTTAEDSYLLSTACDAYDTFEPDKNAIFASAVIKMHLPTEIGEMDFQSYAELRARYESLREAFPIYLNQLRQLYRVTDASNAGDVRNALRYIETKIVADIERIKESKLGATVRRWVSFGISSTLSLGAAIFPESAVSLTLGAIGFQSIRISTEAPKMLGHFDGVRSMLLSANEQILKTTRLSHFLGDEFLRDIGA